MKLRVSRGDNESDAAMAVQVAQYSTGIVFGAVEEVVKIINNSLVEIDFFLSQRLLRIFRISRTRYTDEYLSSELCK